MPLTSKVAHSSQLPCFLSISRKLRSPDICELTLTIPTFFHFLSLDMGIKAMTYLGEKKQPDAKSYVLKTLEEAKVMI